MTGYLLAGLCVIRARGAHDRAYWERNEKPVLRATVASAPRLWQTLNNAPTSVAQLAAEIVPIDLRFTFRPADAENRRLSTRLRELNPCSKYAAFEKLGFEYAPNALETRQIVELADSVREYIELFGVQQQADHYIQRANRHIADRFGVRESIRRHFHVPVDDLNPSFGFNYYQQPTQTFGAHFDNLFLADEVFVINTGAPYTVTFRHWTSAQAFRVLVETGSIYRMRGRVRYDFTHEGHPSSVEEFEGERWTRGERLTFVLGRNGAESEIHLFPTQIWGEPERRAEIDQHVGRKLQLHEYLEFVRIYCRLEGDPYFPPFDRAIDRILTAIH